MNAFKQSNVTKYIVTIVGNNTKKINNAAQAMKIEISYLVYSGDCLRRETVSNTSLYVFQARHTALILHFNL